MKKLTKWGNFDRTTTLTINCPYCDSYKIYDERQMNNEIGIETEDFCVQTKQGEVEYDITCPDCGKEYILDELINN